MQQNKQTPVHGYTPQEQVAIERVNHNKVIEERLLRLIEGIANDPALAADRRWASVAQMHFEQGFMALNRAVFKPTRIRLPDDPQ